MAQSRRTVRSEAIRLADLVRKAVDDGATTAEEIHRAIAEMPLNVLQRLDVFEKTVKDVRRIQDTSIGAVYDTIRRINKEVTGLAAELLKKAPKAPKAPAKRRPARKKAPAPRSAQPSAGA